MSKSEASWEDYLAQQVKLAGRTSVDGESWSLEGRLNRILSSESAISAEQIERIARSERRGERHRARLRRHHLPQGEGAVDGEGVARAHHQLEEVRQLVTDADWDLLSDVAEGSSYDEIASRRGGNSGALRVHVLRLRRTITGALAA